MSVRISCKVRSLLWGIEVAQQLWSSTGNLQNVPQVSSTNSVIYSVGHVELYEFMSRERSLEQYFVQENSEFHAKI